VAIKSPTSLGGGDGYFELIEFSLVRHLSDGREIKGTYGVNVVKVREVIHMPKINPLASTVSGVEGIFELRGAPIPAVNLCTILGDQRRPINPENQIIVTEFAHKRAGFIVDQTNRIRRVPWEKILPPSADKASSMTGMMLIENNEFLFILDLERIIMQLESMVSGRPAFVTDQSPMPPILGPRKAGYPSILLVDDSALILNSIARALNTEGYGVILARNGVEGLQRLDESSNGSPTIDAIITDLEMPQMDGLSMLKRVKANPSYHHIPVYLHSSLSDTGSRETARALGADEFFVKNDVTAILKYLKANLLGSKISA
jgi:two-component system chemotaxis response regulator CheV